MPVVCQNLVRQNLHHAQRIIAPVFAACPWQRCRIKRALFLEIFRVDDDLPIVARRDPASVAKSIAAGITNPSA